MTLKEKNLKTTNPETTIGLVYESDPYDPLLMRCRCFAALVTVNSIKLVFDHILCNAALCNARFMWQYVGSNVEPQGT